MHGIYRVKHPLPPSLPPSLSPSLPLSLSFSLSLKLQSLHLRADISEPAAADSSTDELGQSEVRAMFESLQMEGAAERRVLLEVRACIFFVFV